MKKQYTSPALEVTGFLPFDVIATSDGLQVNKTPTTNVGKDDYEEDYEGWGQQW